MMNIAPYNQRYRLRIVQILVVASIPILALSHTAWAEGSIIREVLELAGFVLLLVCVFGRLWSILYSGGNKNVVLVTSGPYSITRNPLYLFSTLGAVAIGLLFGSIVFALLFGSLTYWILRTTAAGEASFLRSRFGTPYEEYASRVPFFWPNPSLYVESADARFSPKALRATFRDGIFFLGAIPIVEISKHLRSWKLMPDLYPIF